MQLKNHTENKTFYPVFTLPWISWALFIIFFLTSIAAQCELLCYRKIHFKREGSLKFDNINLRKRN